jgi:hypothetical protein
MVNARFGLIVRKGLHVDLISLEFSSVLFAFNIYNGYRVVPYQMAVEIPLQGLHILLLGQGAELSWVPKSSKVPANTTRSALTSPTS